MPKQIQTLTKREIRQDSTLVENLAASAGGMSALADVLHVSRQTLYDWKQKGLPPQFHRLIDLIVGVRPD